MKTTEKPVNLTDFEFKFGTNKNDPCVTITQYIGGYDHVIIPGYINSLQVIKIGDKAFKNCSGLTEVGLPDGLIDIGSYAFSGCKRLAKIRIPESAISIGMGAFENCEELKSVFIPKNVQYLFIEIFSGCSKLKEIIVDDENYEFSAIDGVLFNKEQTALLKYPEGKESTSYTVPDTVTDFDDTAFQNCKELVTVTLPSGLSSLSRGIFTGCKQLKKVTLSRKTKIGHKAFDDSSVEFVYLDR